MKKPHFLFLLVIFLSASGLTDSVFATCLVKNHRPKAQIVITTNDAVDEKAAFLLRDFIERISGARLAIGHDHLRRGDVAIGNGGANSHVDRKDLTDDGFRITNTDGILRIVSGGGHGTLYAAVTLLERFFGVNYWGEHEYSLTPAATLILPKVDFAENPAFHYRQSQHYAIASDSIYAAWLRLENPEEVFAAGYWVHTFDRLLPAAVYGDQHPEYYAWFNGKRHPGKAGQWCLSNPDVLEIVAARIDSIFKANPAQGIISVSQNDGNYTNCRCDRCKAIDDYEGAHSGSLIHFINKLADRFPDRQISTLAYLYTMPPPRHVHPRPNVNIMLCSIDCDRETAMTGNPSGRSFLQALDGWSRISRNVFVWDYGINFDNYLVPFPNLHVMAENLRLFHRRHAVMHFAQVAGSRGGDFAELRTWMAAKLMWNPEADADSLINTFLGGYYGAAAPFIHQYITTMEGALAGSGQRLWIYDSPVTHKHGMFRPALMQRYQTLFDRAEAAVATDSARLARVQRSRLPLRYTALDIARTDTATNTDDVLRQLALFEQQVRKFNVPVINERENTPLEYCRIYRQRYLSRDTANLAFGAAVQYLVPPDGKYLLPAKTALTDGLYGGATFTESWIGWEGTDAAFVVDLGSRRSFSGITVDFLHQLGQWILLPRKVDYSISDDGQEFRPIASIDIPEDRDAQVKFLPVTWHDTLARSARYIKISVAGTNTCPHWHYGVGHPCWFFIDEVSVAPAPDPVDCVDPYIGTGEHGHVFLGANLPFGMVQLGPTNITEGWDWSSGYHYSDSTIFGFTHTHLSGTGIGDLCDIALMPTVGNVRPGKGIVSDPASGAWSLFDHRTETARPGYYAVHLDRYHIDVQLTATSRVGFHHYTFPAADDASIIIDLKSHLNWDKPVDTFLLLENDTTLSGYRFSTGWANDQRLFFSISFSKPIERFLLSDGSEMRPGTRLRGEGILAQACFHTAPNETIAVKVALSPVSIENAAMNMQAELPGWNFTQAVCNARREWNRELQKIEIKTGNASLKRIFYTALYHTMIAPSEYCDVNGDYRGADRQVHHRPDFRNYTTFSLWDTYRAVHPLMTIIHPDRVNDIIHSLLAIYHQQHKLPVWHLAACETDCMVGNPAIPVIADAILKGYNGFDREEAYLAMKQSAMISERGIGLLKTYGYIPYDREPEALSKSLEYAIADHSIAQVAKLLGKKQDCDYFLHRSKAYRHYFDPTTGFMRGRSSDGRFRTPFNPFESVHRDNDYVEGNAWQYTWLVPHDVQGLIHLFGGEKPFIEKLDSLFTVQGSLGIHASPDISGLIGQYAHGNEPSHHIAYLYQYAGQAWKTAEKVRRIMTTLYHDHPSGLAGNEDAGQMSAWYILSSLGFYQVEPSGGRYIFGSPLVDQATIVLKDRNTFRITAENNTPNNPYIQCIYLNGQQYDKYYIDYKDIMQGGSLTFVMGPQPQTLNKRQQ
jgi:predicted alpha-1,2-mannosidase